MSKNMNGAMESSLPPPPERIQQFQAAFGVRAWVEGHYHLADLVVDCR